MCNKALIVICNRVMWKLFSKQRRKLSGLRRRQSGVVVGIFLSKLKKVSPVATKSDSKTNSADSLEDWNDLARKLLKSTSFRGRGQAKLAADVIVYRLLSGGHCLVEVRSVRSVMVCNLGQPMLVRVCACQCSRHAQRSCAGLRCGHASPPDSPAAPDGHLPSSRSLSRCVKMPQRFGRLVMSFFSFNNCIK